MSFITPDTIKKKAIEYIKKEMSVSIVKAYCETCGKVFLEVFLIDFAEKSNSLKIEKIGIPDRWFCNTILHWQNNPNHIVKLKSPKINPNVAEFLGLSQVFVLPENLSNLWKETNEKLNNKPSSVLKYYKNCLRKYSREMEI